MRTLEKEREKRFQSAGEVKTNVEHLTETPAAPATIAPAARTFDPAQDFILCPPCLPRMAKAILVYALLIAPILWIVGLFTYEPLPDNPLVAFAQGMVNLLVIAGEFVVLVSLAVGGWRLRSLRASAVNWLKTSLWLHLSLIVLAIAGQIWVAVLETRLLPDAPATPLNIGDGLFLAIALVSLVFEISSLVWLRRHGALLKSLCTAAVARRGWLGFLKWAAAALIICVVGFVSLGVILDLAHDYFTAAAGSESVTPTGKSPAISTDGAAWIGFTFTAVELREVNGKRWLAIDYLDDVHGGCQKSFPWESKIPGFHPEVRASEFAKDPTDPTAARHQRVEYLLPDSVQSEPLQQLRSNVEKALKQQTIRVEAGQEKLLFEFGSSSDTALKAWLKVASSSKP
jgi:hypothetical protein